jgi:hypothetical protein
MLILGGVIFNVIVCGAVMRPLEGVPTDIKDEDDGDKDTSKDSNPDRKGVESSPESQALLSGGEGEGEGGDKGEGDEGEGKKAKDVVNSSNNKAVSSVPKYLRDGLTFHSQNQLSPPSTNGELAALVHSDGALNRPNGSGAHKRHVTGFARQVWTGSTGSTALRPVGRKDVFYTASLQHIPMYVSHHDLYITSVTELPPVSIFVCVCVYVCVCVGGWLVGWLVCSLVSFLV